MVHVHIWNCMASWLRVGCFLPWSVTNIASEVALAFIIVAICFIYIMSRITRDTQCRVYTNIVLRVKLFVFAVCTKMTKIVCVYFPEWRSDVALRSRKVWYQDSTQHVGPRIPFDGIPFVALRSMQLDCKFGKNRHLSAVCIMSYLSFVIRNLVCWIVGCHLV